MSRRRSYRSEAAPREKKRIVYSCGARNPLIHTPRSLSKEIEDEAYERRMGPPKIRTDFPGPSAFLHRVSAPWKGNNFTVRKIPSIRGVEVAATEKTSPDNFWIQEQKEKEARLDKEYRQKQKALKDRIPLTVEFSCGHTRNGLAWDEEDKAKAQADAKTLLCPVCMDKKIEKRGDDNVESAVIVFSDKWKDD